MNNTQKVDSNKAGKLWLTAGISALGLTVGLTAGASHVSANSTGDNTDPASTLEAAGNQLAQNTVALGSTQGPGAETVADDQTGAGDSLNKANAVQVDQGDVVNQTFKNGDTIPLRFTVNSDYAFKDGDKAVISVANNGATPSPFLSNNFTTSGDFHGGTVTVDRAKSQITYTAKAGTVKTPYTFTVNTKVDGATEDQYGLALTGEFQGQNIFASDASTFSVTGSGQPTNGSNTTSNTSTTPSHSESNTSNSTTPSHSESNTSNSTTPNQSESTNSTTSTSNDDKKHSESTSASEAKSASEASASRSTSEASTSRSTSLANSTSTSNSLSASTSTSASVSASTAASTSASTDASTSTSASISSSLSAVPGDKTDGKTEKHEGRYQHHHGKHTSAAALPNTAAKADSNDSAELAGALALGLSAASYAFFTNKKKKQ